MNTKTRVFLTCVCLVASAANLRLAAQTNYDESAVAPFELPQVLTTFGGKVITTKNDWETARRPEILEAFSREVFGRTPVDERPVRYEVVSEDRNAMEGTAVRKEVRACFSDSDQHCVTILMMLPKHARAVPVFVGLNFEGNHTIVDDPGIQLNEKWMRRTDIRGVVDHRATDASRGTLYNRWQVKMLLERGYGLVTVYQGDFELDRKERSGRDGIRHLFPVTGSDDEWGSLALWSWGLSRVMDYLQTDRLVDARKVALVGHSRLGKAALWAAAQDTRFALVVSNNSGEGGASISRRNYGETIADLNRAVPYWFCPNYKKYNHDPSALPVDAHLLIALMAPRPVYVASATEDQWADPKGEYLAAYYAAPAYGLYGLGGLESKEPPLPDTPVGGGVLGYHLRTGEHDVTAYDWLQYLDFADKHFKYRSKR